MRLVTLTKAPDVHCGVVPVYKVRYLSADHLAGWPLMASNLPQKINFAEMRAAGVKIKRGIFRRLAAHYRILAGELEKAMVASEIKQAGE